MNIDADLRPSPPTAHAQPTFLRSLRRLLDEGTFTATCKYALLHAIADLSVTKGDGSGEALTLSTRELADQSVDVPGHGSCVQLLDMRGHALHTKLQHATLLSPFMLPRIRGQGAYAKG